MNLFCQKSQSLLKCTNYCLFRELSVIIQEQQRHYPSRPVPEKRKGKFKRNRLKNLLRNPCAGHHLISPPMDFRHHITVQPDHTTLRYPSPSSPDSPTSPLVHLRAYACRFFLNSLLSEWNYQ